MREKSVTEQRYDAVLGVISEGRTVMEVAGQFGVSRRTLHRWLARYEADGLEGLPDHSHRPERCPHQMPAEVKVLVLELRRESSDDSAPAVRRPRTRGSGAARNPERTSEAAR
jgi:transposase-like protein